MKRSSTKSGKYVWLKVEKKASARVRRNLGNHSKSEFAAHEWISEHPDVPIYFTDSYISCQKGVTKNANKLIRQYIPKVMNISTVIDGEILKIQTNINRKPQRKT